VRFSVTTDMFNYSFKPGLEEKLGITLSIFIGVMIGTTISATRSRKYPVSSDY
jgi:hypothetical protein